MGVQLTNGETLIINADNFPNAFEKAPAQITITPELCKQESIDEKFVGTYRKNAINFQPFSRNAIFYGKSHQGIVKECASALA